MSVIDTLSYVANIIFVTWGVVEMMNNRKERHEKSNAFNSYHEIAKRFASSLKNRHEREQAENLAILLKTEARTLMGRITDTVGGKERKIFFKGGKKKINL